MPCAKRLGGKEPSTIFPYLGGGKAQTTVTTKERSLEEDIVESIDHLNRCKIKDLSRSSRK